MTLKPTYAGRCALPISLLLITLALLWLNPDDASALGTTLPTFTDFSKTIQNGQKDVLRGVYVDKVMALPVVQKPEGRSIYVTDREGEVAQFGLAAQYGNVGLLAHNHKAGKTFTKLKLGQEVQLIYGDGQVEIFIIRKILKFQALEPTDPYSSFRNLDKDETLTAAQMFNRVYVGQYHLTFQTCIAVGGEPSWGRLFVIAVPKKNIQQPLQQN